MPIQNGRLTQPADGDAANAESVNAAFRALREFAGDLCLRNARLVRLTSTVNSARAALGLGTGIWIVGGGSGDVAITHNGQEWTEVEDSATQTIQGFAKYQSTVIAVGDSGMFGRSTNVLSHAPTWTYTTADAAFAGTFYAAAVGTTHVVVVGSSGEIQRAAVGALGTLAHVANDGAYTGAFKAIVYDASAERFIAFGDDGEIQYSDDEGATWTSLGVIGTAAFAGSATNGEGVICAVTSDSWFWISRDAGLTWDSFVGFPIEYRAMVYNGVHFVALGSSATTSAVVWITPDAESVDLNDAHYLSNDFFAAALGVQPIVDGHTAGVMAAGEDPSSLDMMVARFLDGRV